MLSTVLTIAAAAILSYFIIYIIRHVLLIIKLAQRGVPWMSQLLPFSPVRIPLLAPHLYHGAVYNVIERMDKIGGKGKCFAIVTGQYERVYIANPNDIKQLCIARANKMVKPAKMYEPVTIYGPNIVTTPGGHEWKMHRALCNPAFDMRHLNHMAQVAVQAMNLLTEDWQKRETAGQLEIDPKHEMTLATLDVIGKAGFGVDLKLLGGQKEEVPPNHKLTFREALETTINLTLVVKALAPWMLESNYLGGKAKLAKEEVSQYIDEIIEARRKENFEGSDLLSMLLSVNQTGVNADDAKEVEDEASSSVSYNVNSEKSKLSMDELKSDSWVFLFAGHDTSATALQYLMYEIAKKPEVQEKMIAEIDSVIGTAEPNLEMCKQLKYVNMAINENLRIHPPAPMVVKTCIEPFETECGYKFPANTTYYFSMLYVHRDPENWPEPMEFIPERFEQTPKACTFIPFSTGNRSCIGANFSLYEQCLFITRILQKYTVDFPAGFTAKDLKEDSNGAVLRPTNLRIMMKRRN